MPTAVAEETVMEVWENSTAGRVVLEKFNQTGTLVSEMVRGYGRATITAQERRINQEKCATAAQDPFQNGILQPRVVDESDPTAKTLLDNPNVLDEKTMRSLFKMTGPQAQERFEARLKTITHAPVLNGLLQMAVDVDATLSQYRAIHARLDEVAPLLATEIVSAGADADAGRPSRPVSPR